MTVSAPHPTTFADHHGEMAARIRAHDWPSTPLGPLSQWPQGLRTATRFILNTDHPACLFWGPGLQCVYNDAYGPILGADRHPHALGRPASWVWDDVWPQVEPEVAHVLAGRGGVNRADHLLPVVRDGVRQPAWWTYSYAPIDCDSVQSGIGGVLVLCAEVTDRVLLRDAVRLGDERIRVALDAAELGWWELDLQSGVSDRRSARHDLIYGHDTPLPVWGLEQFKDYLLADDAPAFQAAFARAQSSGNLDCTLRIRRRDGAIRWIALRGRTLRSSSVAGERMVGTIQDVTEQVRLRDDLRALVEERTAERDRLWKLSEDLLVLADADGRLLRTSPSWRGLLGHDRLGLLRSTFIDLLHPEDRAAAAALLDDMRRSSQPVRFEARMRGTDERDRAVSWTLSPEPETGRMVGVGRDVTADRAAMAELARVQEQLVQSQKLETVGQLTGGIAHDFNNLLTPIIGGLDMLRRRVANDERALRLIDNAAQGADRAKTLVSRLLSFAGRQHLDARPVDVAILVEGMRDLIARSIGPTIVVTVEAGSDLPLACVDPTQLELALLNLCVNARDAMKEGGRITISLDADQKFVRLRVADTGGGMDPVTMARAVEPFFTTKGVGRGTGLGLSMVHGLASQSGGSLTLSSVVGQGTMATLLLPVADSPAAATGAGPAKEESTAPTGAVTVLLVDDEELVRANTAELLRDLGHTVLVAPDAEQAMRIVADDADTERAIGALVTDYVLPGQSGAYLAAAVRRLRPDLPVLLVTGYAPLQGQQPDPSLPRLTKPFRQAELAARLDELLKSRG